MLRLLPLVAGLLPVIAIHLSFLVAVGADRVPGCFPYIDGCTSISSTGRHAPASLLFKGAMLPQAVLLIVYWLAMAAWLQALLPKDAPARTTGRAVAVMGSTGALALVIYVTFLGSSEPFYEFMRRFGIYFYFLLTILAQLAVSIRLRRLLRSGTWPELATLCRIKLALALAPFLLGALNLVLKNTLDESRAAENVTEWLVALLMQAWIAASYVGWRQTGFRQTFSVSAR